MKITQELTLDLIKRDNTTPILDLVQGDTARQIRLTLLRDGEPWIIPEDAIVILRYAKPDGTGGAYDTLEDGSRAWSVQENTITLTLAPQVCTASGVVQLQVSINKEKEQLSTFTFLLRAEKEINGEGKSGEYVNLAAWMEKHGRGEKGDPGVSPCVEISDIPDGHRVTITDANGEKTFDVPNSQIPTAHLLRIAALEEKAYSTLSGTGSVSFSARVGSGITFVGNMTASQSGEGDPTPDNIRPITLTDSVTVSIAKSSGAVQQSHTIALPASCPVGYIDWARRKYVQTHKQLVLTGTENWASTWAGRCCGLNIEDCVAGNEADKIDAVYCTHYTTTLSANIYNQTVDNAICTITNYGSIRIRDTGRLDVAAFKAYLAEQYAAGMPVTVVYKLAVPVEYDLGVLPSLKALEVTTVFSCDTNDGFTVQYNHDELAVANWESLRDRTDFIVAEGESGIWHYRKWNSGLAECWGKAEKTVAITTQMGNVYINGTASDTTVMYPFKFVEIPNCTFSVVANYAAWYGGGTAITSNESESLELLKSQTPKVYIYKVTQGEGVSATIHFNVKGRWK